MNPLSLLSGGVAGWFWEASVERRRLCCGLGRVEGERNLSLHIACGVRRLFELRVHVVPRKEPEASSFSSLSLPMLETIQLSAKVNVQPNRAYDACLKGWKHTNFNLPIPPPWVINKGHPDSAEKFEIMRLPLALRERFVRAKRPKRIEYVIVNPGYFTYPVSHHSGIITFEPNGTGTDFTWKVSWKSYPGFGWFVNTATRWVVRKAARYTVRECLQEDEEGTIQEISHHGVRR